jgi:putative ABC transport system ATP-binding protein
VTILLRPPVLELVDVVKEYPSTPPVRALDGVTLTVFEQDLVGVVGPSGSGKSTLLAIVGALDLPTSGSVRIAGREIAGRSDRELSALRGAHIGFVFQQFHLIEGLTALENVTTALIYRGVSTRERRSRARHALERVGLTHRANHRASALSGGERQRVAIARAIVNGPSIILADEPTGNLDSHTGAEIVELLEALHAEGATIVVITHDDAIASRMHTCVELRDGQIVGERVAPLAPASAGRFWL